MKKLLLAFQFLTIIPIKAIKNVSEKEIGEASAFFPAVGLFEGTLLLGAATFFMKVFPPELTNGLLILLIVIGNGGLHLDGLADTFDAIASRGSTEKKLAIMKDSSAGPAGVIAIVLALLLKYIMLNALLLHTSLKAYNVMLFFMPVLSRWAMVPAIIHGKPARGSGLGQVFIEHTGKRELLTATVLTLLIWVMARSFILDLRSFRFTIILMIPLLYIFSLAAAWFCNKKFSGMTGDTFGAVNEIAALLFLLSGLACLQKSI